MTDKKAEPKTRENSCPFYNNECKGRLCGDCDDLEDWHAVQKAEPKIECSECDGHGVELSGDCYCNDCNWPGSVPISECVGCDSSRDCPNCNGTGEVPV